MKVNFSSQLRRIRDGVRVSLYLLVLLLSYPFAAPLLAEVIRVGVAANFMRFFREIARSFENATHCEVQSVFTSTGNLYAQILSGAPYDLLLAADGERPALLHGKELAEKPFTYAIGRVILWTSERNICQALARRPRVPLLDEPFSALDVITRGTLRDTIISLKSELGIPITYVTHDKTEALSMADRILPIVEGRVEEGWIDGPATEVDDADNVVRLPAARARRLTLAY